MLNNTILTFIIFCNYDEQPLLLYKFITIAFPLFLYGNFGWSIGRVINLLAFRRSARKDATLAKSYQRAYYSSESLPYFVRGSLG